jgi:acyl carrier protein
MSDQLESRVRGVIRQTFALSEAESGGPLAMGQHPSWDSLGHMQLLSAIEKEFQVRFPIFRMSHLTSIDAIVSELAVMGAGDG